MKIIDIFDIKIAKSKGNEDYDPGEIPFVTSTTMNNGVIKFVDPYPDDKVYSGSTICISGLGFATLQLFPYLPKGNGGDSATILIPKSEMDIKELIFYVATFNLLHNWRFSFGRKCSKERIQYLELEPYAKYNNQFFAVFDDFMKQYNSTLNTYSSLIE